jgi:hypothetical protein
MQSLRKIAASYLFQEEVVPFLLPFHQGLFTIKMCTRLGLNTSCRAFLMRLMGVQQSRPQPCGCSILGSALFFLALQGVLKEDTTKPFSKRLLRQTPSNHVTDLYMGWAKVFSIIRSCIHWRSCDSTIVCHTCQFHSRLPARCHAVTLPGSVWCGQTSIDFLRRPTFRRRHHCQIHLRTPCKMSSWFTPRECTAWVASMDFLWWPTF